MTTSQPERALRAHGLRVTKPRLAVLTALAAHPHSDAETVLGAVRQDLPEVSHQAVYDSLNTLSAAGVIRRIQPTGSLARYETRTHDNHHHVVCRTCGAVSDVDCAVGHTPCLTAADDHGFVIDEAEVIYWGTCPTCASPAITPASTTTPISTTRRHLR